jgi:hypothetical protein
MQLIHRLFATIVMLVGIVTLAWGQAADTPAEFAKLHKELTATKEAWQAIPWHVSLLEARTQAAKENKPIYMLCRAGHPLGCV